MPGNSSHTIPTTYSAAELWNIAETSVLDAAQMVDGNKRPGLLTPMTNFISAGAGAMGLLSALQTELAHKYGLVVDFLNDPPIDPGNIAGATFLTLAQAVDTRLAALGAGS